MVVTSEPVSHRPRLAHCDFCDEFAGGTRNAFAERYGAELKARSVMETANFRAVPSLGQIVEGYLLIVPDRHFLALADLPDNLFAEFCDLVERVSARLRDAYGPSVLFENGTRSIATGGCGVYHAHLHLVPLSDGQDPIEALKQELPWSHIESIQDIRRRASGSASYIYYRDLRSKNYLFQVDRLSSQHIRRLLGERTGNAEWNWRKHGREEALVRTMNRLSLSFMRGVATPQPAYGVIHAALH